MTNSEEPAASATVDRIDATLHTLKARLQSIRRRIRKEYLESHRRPWIIGFSGGKDSTLLLQLVLETILTIPPDERTRPVYVLSNDTLVESPIYQSQVVTTLDLIREGVEALGLPVEVVQTFPDDDWSFWVTLLGRGYPAPNRSFRWCTDRMKIRPTTKFIKTKVAENGEVVLLLGVRKAESSARATRIQGYENSEAPGQLSPHNDVKGCLIFRPIADLDNDDVWHVLLNVPAPWGGDHRALVTLYRNALGGECPFIMSEADSPSCGSTSARFGCWTCTVVDKDASLDGLIESGLEHLAPLSAFRNRLKEASNTPEYRSKVRRNGQPGLGPLTVDARRMLLEELLATQATTQLQLITDHEIHLIRDWWERDETTAVVREMEQLVQLGLPEKEAHR
jgi:DNA sulfur modification protein DndC